MIEYFGRDLFIGDFVITLLNGTLVNGLVVDQEKIYIMNSEHKYGTLIKPYTVIKCEMLYANERMQECCRQLSKSYNIYNMKIVQANHTLENLEPLTLLSNDKERVSLYLGYVNITHTMSNGNIKSFTGHCYIKLDMLGITSKGALNSLLHNPISINKLFSLYRKELSGKIISYNKKESSLLISRKISNSYIFKYSNELVRLQDFDDNYMKTYNLGFDKLIIDFVDIRKKV